VKSLIRIITGAKVEYAAELERIDFSLAREWLSQTYWSKGISRQRVEDGFRSSTAVVSAHCGGQMKGIARCLSDTTRFGYIADVYVAPDMRGKGVAREMVRHLMQRPALRNTEHWYLLTRDAHEVYSKLGFRVYDKPERFMHLDRSGKLRRGKT
jgi:N-acetylglutamate synthase-like GNAT family acetyltransferase